MAGILDKISNAVNTVKSLPPNSGEMASIKAKKQNVDDYMKATSGEPDEPKATPPATNPNKVDKSSQYGTRPGEYRYSDAEIKDMTKPLIPTYDKGGDVTVKKTNIPAPKKVEPKPVIR